MDLIPVILYSHMANLQRDGILEAKSALAATKLITLPPKRSAECGLQPIFSSASFWRLSVWSWVETLA